MLNGLFCDTRTQVSDSSHETNEIDLQKTFLELLNEFEKLDVAHNKLKLEFHELQLKYDKALDEEVILRNKISNLEMKESESNVIEKLVECLSCKSHMFDIDILENLLVKASKFLSHVQNGFR